MSLSIYSSGIKFGPNSTNCSQNKSNLNGLVCFTENSINRGQVCEAVFDGCSVNFGTGDIGVFVGSSVNQGVTEAAVFSGNAVNVGVIASATFLGSAVNSGSVITGTFSETSKNAGYICVAQFEANALNSGFVSGTASFAGNAVNAGSVSGVASFVGAATNSGTLVCGGQRTFYIQNDSKSLTPGITGFGLLSEIDLSGKCLWSNSSLTNGQQITECSFYYDNSCYYANSSGRINPFLSTCNLCDFLRGSDFDYQNPQLTNKLFYFSASDFPISFKTPSGPCDPTGILCMTGDILNFSGKRVYLDKSLTTVRTGFNFHFLSALPNPNKTTVDGDLCGFWVDVSGRVSGAYALWPTGGISHNTYNCKLNYTGFPLYHSTGSTTLNGTIIYSNAQRSTPRTGIWFTAYRKEDFPQASCLYNTTGEYKAYTTNISGFACERAAYSGCSAGGSLTLFLSGNNETNRNPDGKTFYTISSNSTRMCLNSTTLSFCTGLNTDAVFRASYPIDLNYNNQVFFAGNISGCVNAYKSFTGVIMGFCPFYFCTGNTSITHYDIQGATGYSNAYLTTRLNCAPFMQSICMKYSFYSTGMDCSFVKLYLTNNGVFDFQYGTFLSRDVTLCNSGGGGTSLYISGNDAKNFTGSFSRNQFSGVYVWINQSNTTGLNGLNTSYTAVNGICYRNNYVIPHNNCSSTTNHVDDVGFHISCPSVGTSMINSIDRYYQANRLDRLNNFGLQDANGNIDLCANPFSKEVFSRNPSCNKFEMGINATGFCSDSIFQQSGIFYYDRCSGQLTCNTDTNNIYIASLTGVSNLWTLFNLQNGRFTRLFNLCCTGVNSIRFNGANADGAIVNYRSIFVPSDNNSTPFTPSNYLSMALKYGVYSADHFDNPTIKPQGIIVEFSSSGKCWNGFPLPKDGSGAWSTMSASTTPILVSDYTLYNNTFFCCPSTSNRHTSIMFMHSFSGWGACPIASGFGGGNYATGSSFITTGTNWVVTSGCDFYAQIPHVEGVAGGGSNVSRKPNITGKFLAFDGVVYRINFQGKLTPSGYNPSSSYF